MKSYSTLSVSTLLAMLLLLAGCSLLDSLNNDPYHGQFILDNPTDSPIEAVVDGKQYNLAPLQYEVLTLEPGLHSMTTAYGEKVDFIVTVENNGGVLNPTHSMYYKYAMQYVEEGREPTLQSLNMILIDSIEYDLPVEKIIGVILDEKTVDWQFPIFTPFEETKYTTTENLRALIQYKLFTKTELIDFLEEGTEDVGFHEANAVKTKNPLPIYETNEKPAYFVPDFKTAEIKRLAAEMVELDKEYGKAETADRQRELLKEYAALWKAYVEEGIKEEYDKAEYEKKAQLVFHNFNKGIIIL